MKILGVGIDLLTIDRVNHLYLKYGEKLVKKVLSREEVDFIKNMNLSPRKTANFIAKRFSIKESILKALGIGMGRGIGLTDISIINDTLDRPCVTMNESSLRFLRKLHECEANDMAFNVSVTDQGNFINSIAIISVG